MARPHVELIDQQDYLWHPAELPMGTGEARQQNLSYDEEDGSASLRVRFDTDWHRPGGWHNADTEWYVLDGEITIGEEQLGRDGYVRVPRGVAAPSTGARAGTEVLLFREYGDWGFVVSERNRDGVDDGEIVVLDTAAMDWISVETGSPAKDTFGFGAPVPGLFIKLLFHDEQTGFYTRLIRAAAGWTEHPLAHHPCFEEAYTLQGSMEYSYGSLYPGTYFFRPPRIRHGNFRAGPEGTTWIIRSDGDLVNWYTDNATVEMKGTAINFAPDGSRLEPMLPDPVRSRSTREWQRIER